MRGKFELLAILGVVGCLSFICLTTWDNFSSAQPVVGLSLNATNAPDNYVVDTSVVANNTEVIGIWVANDTTTSLNLTINATVNATANNDSGGAWAFGVLGEGFLEEESSGRPIELTVTEEGQIIASANGTEGGGDLADVLAGGAVGNFTRVDNRGVILVSGQASDTASLLVGGIVAADVEDFANSGEIHVEGTGGYIDLSGEREALPVGVDLWTVNNFSNEGNITVTIESVNATALGVRADQFGSVDNSGRVTVTVKGKEGSGFVGGAGLYAGYPGITGEGEPGNIGRLTNEGKIEVKVYGPSDTDTYVLALGVYSHGDFSGDTPTNGTIGSFNNTGEVSVEAEGRSVIAFGVYADTVAAYVGNSGNVTAMGNGEEESFVAGVVGNLGIGKLENSGSVKATSESDSGDSYAFAVLAGNPMEDENQPGSIGELNNFGQIFANSMAKGEARAFGVFVNKGQDEKVGDLEKLVNAGTIGASATGDSAFSEGVYADSDIGTFENTEGSLIFTEARAAEGEARAAGIVAGDKVTGSFTNAGKIEAKAISGSGVAIAAGLDAVSVASFDNSGKILVSAEGSINGTAYGTVIGGDLGSFENEGNIKAEARADSDDADSYGVWAWSVGNFTIHGGEIQAVATGHDADAYGLWVDDSIGTFVMKDGKLLASTAEATGRNSEVDGIYVGGDLGSFTMDGGEIKASANATDVDADAFGLYVEGSISNLTLKKGAIKAEAYTKGAWAWAYALEASVIQTFQNEGTLSAQALSEGSGAAAFGVVTDKLENFSNKGEITASVKSSNKAPRIEAAALRVTGSPEALITNNGTMKVSLDLPSGASMDDVKAAVFWIESSNATLSNYGYGWVESTVGGEDLRILRITGRSKVILQDKFAITFGTPGVDPETRPIYVGEGSVLDLGQATLVARVDSRNLKYDVPYYLIESKNGTVQGKWGGLEKGYQNPTIEVNWYGEDRAADSAVIFSYQPLQAPSPVSLAPVLGGTVGTPVFVSSFGSYVSGFSPLMMILAEKPGSRMLASVRPTGIALREAGRAALWATPFYTRVEADDLGFDADSSGFAMGFGYRLAEGFGAELYGGYLRNDIDYSVKGARSEDQDLYLGGLNLLYAPEPYFVMLSALGFKGDHDYSGFTGLNYDLVEKASYDSRGVRLDLMAGRVFGGTLKLVPQMGVSYARYKTDAFWTKVPENPDLRRRYEPEDMNVVKVLGGFDLMGDVKGSLRLYAGARLEQAFTDNDVSAITYAPGQPRYKLEKSIADTTVSLQGGAVWKYGNWGLELSGRGDFNADYCSYMGKVSLRYSF